MLVFIHLKLKSSPKPEQSHAWTSRAPGQDCDLELCSMECTSRVQMHAYLFAVVKCRDLSPQFIKFLDCFFTKEACLEVCLKVFFTNST